MSASEPGKTVAAVELLNEDVLRLILGAGSVAVM